MINWKPIEELVNEKDIDVIAYADNKVTFPTVTHINVGFDGSSEDVSYLINNEFVVDRKEIMAYLHDHGYTHYALLTPPKTNQSNN